MMSPLVVTFLNKDDATGLCSFFSFYRRTCCEVERKRFCHTQGSVYKCPRQVNVVIPDVTEQRDSVVVVANNSLGVQNKGSSFSVPGLAWSRWTMKITLLYVCLQENVKNKQQKVKAWGLETNNHHCHCFNSSITCFVTAAGLFCFNCTKKGTSNTSYSSIFLLTGLCSAWHTYGSVTGRVIPIQHLHAFLETCTARGNGWHD